MADHDDMHLHEQLMLLALRDEKGTLESSASMYACALGGAILTELSLEGRIRISRDKKALVGLVDRSPLGEPVLDECLDRVARARRGARAVTWVQRFAGTKRLYHRVAEGLCRRGILREEEGRVLLFFTRKVYPTVDPGPERRLVERLRSAVFSDSTTDAETAIVVALANATGLLAIHFDRKELRRRKDRLERITERTPGGAAARQAVEGAEAAILAAAGATVVTTGG
ncbi:MAG: GPP34 family phosphoprotein [Gammaproteobacteria bacterium]|nr:GPP34 family phosphoprotein [Gammaproteobacteria bacterium]MDE0451081.1 GPP34 family phosphoprotein [Gammaproteobacteria bacterium]